MLFNDWNVNETDTPYKLTSPIAGILEKARCHQVNSRGLENSAGGLGSQ